MDASEYIKNLKQKVVRLNQEIACDQDTLHKHNSIPTVVERLIRMIPVVTDMHYSSFIRALVDHHPAGDSICSMQQVTVETLGHGFLVNVFSDKNCPGLLVSILEAFDDLGLNVLEATASCADTFRLEAVGGEVIHQDRAQSNKAKPG
jgi:hypothetical protein